MTKDSESLGWFFLRARTESEALRVNEKKLGVRTLATNPAILRKPLDSASSWADDRRVYVYDLRSRGDVLVW